MLFRSMWIKVSGPRAVQAAEEESAWEAEYGPKIDALIAMMFAGMPGFDPAAGPFEGTPERAQWQAQQEAARAANGVPPAGANVMPGMVLQTFTPGQQ